MAAKSAFRRTEEQPAAPGMMLSEFSRKRTLFAPFLSPLLTPQYSPATFQDRKSTHHIHYTTLLSSSSSWNKGLERQAHRILKIKGAQQKGRQGQSESPLGHMSRHNTRSGIASTKCNVFCTCCHGIWLPWLNSDFMDWAAVSGKIMTMYILQTSGMIFSA